MSTAYPRHYQSKPAKSLGSRTSDLDYPHPTPPPEDYVKTFEACAATASYFLYAQGNVILSLHHDTLTIDRRFEKHKDEVLLIAADNVSDKGAGRLAVSYDSSQTAIVWDLFTGDEVARFASFETIKVAVWMRSGAIAFGNSQGAIILFEPDTSEHDNTRTIFDPVTALAPCSDNRTFAIGYQNGSILIATLAPTFTILHTLTTSRAPTPIYGLAWHGSSSKQKTDMLATQSADGVLRVWSVAKAPHTESPRVIRVLDSTEVGNSTRNWFAWSKNGRLVNYADGDVRAWDVRTKRITNTQVPVVDNVAAIASYGPSGSLFTLSQNYAVQQYDLVAENGPTMVKQAFHRPPNAPPTPPGSTEIPQAPQARRSVPVKAQTTAPPAMPIQLDTDTSASEDEAIAMSPLQRIAKEEKDLEEEERDKVLPLSPLSSSRASLSSASSYGKSVRSRNRAPSNRSSERSSGTLFSGLISERSGNDSVSIRSGTSMASSRHGSSKLRHQTMRSPDEAKQTKLMDLFPYTKARLSDVRFRPPQYDQTNFTPDMLRCEMLSVIFGWHDDIESLIREEQVQHLPGSASGVLLSKWLGDVGADNMAQMVGSESMTSSDWMLLALSCSMGQGSQKQIGEAFVRRLLETDEIHPAVAILLGLGEPNEAVEVYVSRKYYMEAVLLTCLYFPHDWQRQSHLVRKWGEVAVSHGQPELAVRCFSCTSIESSEPWFSPKSQDMVYQAQQQILAPEQFSSPTSPPSATSASRRTAKNASLKLITTFETRSALRPRQQPESLGATPIADTAMTPSTAFKRTYSRGLRDGSEQRTATPGGSRRTRLPSSTRQFDADSTPVVEVPHTRRRATPALSETADEPATVIDRARRLHIADRSRSSSRPDSRDRNRHNLSIDTTSSVAGGSVVSSRASESGASRGRHRRDSSLQARVRMAEAEIPLAEDDAISPSQLTGASLSSYKGRSIDRYINSLEEANVHAQHRSESRPRNASQEAHSRSRTRNRERSQISTDFIPTKGGKKSPTSPKSFTVEESRAMRQREESERQNEMVSPVEPRSARPRASSKKSSSRVREESPDTAAGVRAGSRANSRTRTRGASRRRAPETPIEEEVQIAPRRQSPTSPVSMDPYAQPRPRQQSSSRRPTPRPEESRSTRARSSSRRPREQWEEEPEKRVSDGSGHVSDDRTAHERARSLSRKEIAAQELEQRRQSLLRRPSATPIPQPGETYYRPAMSPRSATDGDFLSSKSFAGYEGHTRSHTVDPEAMNRYNLARSNGSSMGIGLPSTPKAMRNQKIEEDGQQQSIPAVPALPDNFQTLAAVSYQPKPPNSDTVGPLLPTSVFSQKPPLLRSASAPPEKFGSTFGGNSPIRVSPTYEQFRRDSNTSKQSSRRGSVTSQHHQQTSASSPRQLTGSRQPSLDYSHNTFLDVSPEETNVVVVPETNHNQNPPVLQELAHLAGPPPPPPPPTMYSHPPPPPPPPLHASKHGRSFSASSQGVINIAIDAGNSSNSTGNNSPAADAGLFPMPVALNATLPLNSPNNLSNSRRNPSISNMSEPASATSSSGTSRWARVAEKMRSSSRSRNANRTPVYAQSPVEGRSTYSVNATPSPYESILPNTAFNRTRTPQIEAEAVLRNNATGMAGGTSVGRYGSPAPYETPVESGAQWGSPEKGTGRARGASVSTTSTGGSGAGGATGGTTYRNPKEVRAGYSEWQ